MVQEVNKAKIEAKSGLEDCCVAWKFKFETGHREESEKGVQDARNQLDQNKLAENDEIEAQQKKWKEADMVIDMPGAAQHRHEVMQRLLPNIQSIQKTVQVPRVQSIDRVVDDPTVMSRQASTIEARDGQDGPRGPRRDSAGKQVDEVQMQRLLGRPTVQRRRRRENRIKTLKSRTSSGSAT